MSTTTHDFKPTKVVASEQPATNFKMIAENVTITYGGVPAVENVTMKFKEKSVTSLIGPSGCGKTTFLRCLNRMHDMTKNAKVTGKVSDHFLVCCMPLQLLLWFLVCVMYLELV